MKEIYFDVYKSELSDKYTTVNLIKITLIRMQQVTLTSSEKNKIQNEKQIYVLLRLIHCVEKYYMYDRIDKNTYQTEINRLLEKYKRFSQMIPNHTIDSFCKTFNIPNEEISWARTVIEKGISTEEQQNKGALLYVQATAKFIETMDSMTENVGESKTLLQQLRIILGKLCSKLNSPQFNQKFKLYQELLKNYVSSRNINDTMTSSEFKEIQDTIRGLYGIMQIQVKS